MKVYTATFLKRTNNNVSVAAEVFSQLETAQAWANEKIDEIAMKYDYDVTERSGNYFRANGARFHIMIREKVIRE